MVTLDNPAHAPRDFTGIAYTPGRNKPYAVFYKGQIVVYAAFPALAQEALARERR